jgi:uncharacterized membrane protein YraQ (UPF0718 family)
MMMSIIKIFTEFYFQVLSYLEGTYTLRIIENFFGLFINIAPYLLISILINVAAVRFFRGKNLNFSSKSRVISIFIGALIGLVSPLPTYAAIPIGVSLVAAGIPFSAIMAFILASPLMNPSIFFLTATQLGMEMAVVRTLAAFIIALTGGFITMKILKSIYVQKTFPNQYKSKNRPIFKEIYRNSLYVVKTFSIAILLSAVVKSLVPQEVVTGLLGGDGTTGTLVAMGMGIPFYTCGGAAIPFMETLLSLGMSKGAVLAFFLAGPATKLETLYAYKTLLGLKVLVFYLVLTLLFSFFAGIIYLAL